MLLLKNLLLLLRQAVERWTADRAPRLSAALAYYATFSLAPLALVTIWIAGRIFGDSTAQRYLIDLIAQNFGAESAAFVHDMIGSVYRNSASPLFGFIAVIGLLFGATGLFFGMQDALNTIWNVPPDPPRNIWRSILGLFQDRALSFVMVLASGGILTVSLAISTLLTVLDPLLRMLQPQSAALLNVIDLLISFVIVTVLFAVIYRILPETRVTWRDVWLGALSGALLFTVGKFVLSLYLTYSNIRTVFGAASSFVVILIWIYYSAQIFLFGAEVCRVYAMHSSRTSHPSVISSPPADTSGTA
ncbi:MAG TPA: YihY/virulence factor BrkB family protein [Anaerolineae bacterium]|nr:YihY/virulence factor BrkB family protein [Anaerolineae bacterium]